jgi:hypothetical protein
MTNDKTMSETIFTGYLPGAIGRIVELHANTYHLDWGFGVFFEARVAKEMAAFLRRAMVSGSFPLTIELKEGLPLMA